MLVQKLLIYCSLLLFLGCQRELDPIDPPDQTGKVVFWAKKGCSEGEKIVVSIDAKTLTISSFADVAPVCDDAIVQANILRAGTYNWNAYCLTDTISGTVTIEKGSCKIVELVFDDIPPPATGKVTFWAKQSCAKASPIIFSFNNVKDSIVSFVANEPVCGGTGGKSFQLPIGTYSWKAFCSSDSITGTVNVTKDQCSLIDLTFLNQPAAVDTEYIKFKVNGDAGIFNCPPDSVLEANSQGNSTSLQVLASYKGQPQNWYGVLFSGPASTTGTHTVVQLKLPGMVIGMSDTLKVNITNYGNVGEHIEGNLKGKIRDDFYNSIFDVEMEFRIRRRK